MWDDRFMPLNFFWEGRGVNGKEWGVSTGDLSPLGLQAHITMP